MEQRRIVIIGGGITGLSAAYYLEKMGAKNIVLLEASDRVGGKIGTIRENGFLVEMGPDSLVTTKPWGIELIKELGLESELIAPVTSRFYILRNNRLIDIPEGFRQMRPTKVWPFFTSDLFSLPGKLRIMMEPFIRKGTIDKDESLAAFITRRFGHEMLDNYAEPLFTGIYSTPAEKLSMEAAYPMFRQMERKYGSVTRALIAQSTGKNGNGGSRSPFMGLRNGMKSLIDALEGALKETKLLANTSISGITKTDSSKYRISYVEGAIEADELIITTTAKITSQLLKDMVPGLSSLLETQHYSSSQILTLAYRKEEISQSLDATGYVVPEKERNLISACTWSASKWEGRAPEGYTLMRCFFGKKTGRLLSEEELLEAASKELKPILGIKADKPAAFWHNSLLKVLPQYRTGHQQWHQSLLEVLKDHKGLHIAGAAYEGAGIPDCINQGKKAATQVLRPQ